MGNGLTAKFLQVPNAFFNSPTSVTHDFIGLMLPNCSPLETEKVNSLGDYLQSVWKL